MVTVHAVPALIVADHTENVIPALAVPLLAYAAVKVVAPHPDDVVTDGVPANVKDGRTRAIVSHSAIFTFDLNVKEMEEAVPSVGVAMVNEEVVNATAVVAVEVVNAVAGALVAPAMVAAILRVFRLAAWAAAGAVAMAAADVMVHAVPAANGPFATV